MGVSLSLCFLLTAGLGTRLRPYTEVRPKPCLPFLNLPLMNYSFYLARKAGCEHFLMNLHHLPEQVRQQGERLSAYTQSIQFSDESEKILGSAGALYQARQLLSQQDDFWVANGDEVLFPEDTSILSKLIEKRRKEGALACLLTCDHPDLLKKFNGVWVNDQHQVVGFGKTPPEPNSRPVHYTGYKVFSRQIFNYIPEGESNIFYEVLSQAIAKGEKVSHLHLGSAAWYEAGHLDGFLSASRQVALNHPSALQAIHRDFDQEISIHHNAKGDPIVLPTQDQNLVKQLQWEHLLVLGADIKNLPQTLLKSLVVESHYNFTPSSPQQHDLLLAESPRP